MDQASRLQRSFLTYEASLIPRTALWRRRVSIGHGRLLRTDHARPAPVGNNRPRILIAMTDQCPSRRSSSTVRPHRAAGRDGAGPVLRPELSSEWCVSLSRPWPIPDLPAARYGGAQARVGNWRWEYTKARVCGAQECRDQIRPGLPSGRIRGIRVSTHGFAGGT